MPSSSPTSRGGFLQRKWAQELDYRLIKELWAFTDDRIAVRFVYESHDPGGRWRRGHGNEMWLLDPDGYMAERHASIDDVRFAGSERPFRWSLDRRPGDHPDQTELGL